ncbi:DUF6448 family protein [Streptomyces sp. bgisy032]|uniref:DUF6448 family protein n=1 Tax=Streptomyces sp. bgisy032 TaxID=3413773 RepID=UPI003D72CD5E
MADRSFFEAVVRVHRAGEGSPFTGLNCRARCRSVISAVERACDSGFPRSCSASCAGSSVIRWKAVWAHRPWRQTLAQPHP